MTKQVVGWYKKMSFWTKIKAVLVACGAGGEITILIQDSAPWWHGIVVGATFVSIVITNFVKDMNNNGIVDSFEDEKEKPEDQSGS